MRLTRKIDQTLQPILDPGLVPLLFIIGVILLSLIGNAIYEGLKSWLQTPLAILLLSLAVFLLILITYQLYQYLFRPAIHEEAIDPHPGLIALVSPGKTEEILAADAIRFHYRGQAEERPAPTLRHCWLITTPQPPPNPDSRSPSAWENAHELQRQYLDHFTVHLKVVDPYNATAAFEAVEQAYAEAGRLGLRARDLVADITGGTKMMTAGMILACNTAGRQATYMRPNQVDDKGLIIRAAGSTPIRVNLRLALRTAQS